MKKLFITFIAFTFNIVAYASSYCSNQVSINLNYLKTQKQIEKIETQLANNKTIAQKADKILLGLIQQKSPTITNWIKKRNLNPDKDDELIVQKWRQYFLTDFMFRAYPVNEQDIDILIEKHFNHINDIVFTKKLVSKFEKLFALSKDLSVKKITSYPLTPVIKKNIINEIQSIKLYWMKDFKSSKYAKFPMEYIDWGIAFDPSSSEINMGLHSVNSPNDETVVAVFAHEIAHAFDPCRFQHIFKEENPFTKIISCLRSNESVAAKTRNDTLMENLIKRGTLSKELADELIKHPNCNKSNYPPVGIQKDQINEVFADWFSAEVISTSSLITKKLRADLCLDNPLTKGSSYIENIDRLNKIYLANPTIGKKVNFKPISQYCLF